MKLNIGIVGSPLCTVTVFSTQQEDMRTAHQQGSDDLMAKLWAGQYDLLNPAQRALLDRAAFNEARRRLAAQGAEGTAYFVIRGGKGE